MGYSRGKLLLALAMLIAAAGCHTNGTHLAGVANFAEVDSSLCRGGQPTREGIDSLRQKGVKTIINLRDDPDPREKSWVESAGLRYVCIPMNAGRVDPHALRAFLSDVRSAPHPIFVHCRHGRDRTGLSVAVYRIVIEDWTRDAALAELYAHGHLWAIFPGIARYIRTFSVADYLPATSS